MRQVRGSCQCKNVCATYLWHRKSCIGTKSSCPNDPYTYETKSNCKFGLEVFCDTTTTSCEGSCVCNIFGCNCDPCQGCPEFTSSNLSPLEDECANFDEWTKMTEAEKVERLSKYCVDDNGDEYLDIFEPKANIILMAKKLVDERVGNNDTIMQCEEFNKAYIEVRAAELCTLVSSTPFSELNTPSNSSGPPCSATTLLNMSMIVLAAAWLLN